MYSEAGHRLLVMRLVLLLHSVSACKGLQMPCSNSMGKTRSVQSRWCDKSFPVLCFCRNHEGPYLHRASTLYGQIADVHGRNMQNSTIFFGSLLVYASILSELPLHKDTGHDVCTWQVIGACVGLLRPLTSRKRPVILQKVAVPKLCFQTG